MMRVRNAEQDTPCHGDARRAILPGGTIRGRAMFTRRSILLGAAGALLAAPALAADESARPFVTAIYATYKATTTKASFSTKRRPSAAISRPRSPPR